MASVWPFDVLDEREAEQLIADQRDREQLDGWLLCSACHQRVTAAGERLIHDGGHEHHCTNPQGVIFRIGCFADAPGCSAQGPATEHWTWFDGYAWRVAECTRCGTHLGWDFRTELARARPAAFFALILDRLVKEQDIYSQ